MKPPLILSLFTVVLLCLASSLQADDVDFARDVLPILSNKCFVCHGPDSNDAEMLRLDTEELATVDRGGYRAINQGCLLYTSPSPRD